MAPAALGVLGVLLAQPQDPPGKRRCPVTTGSTAQVWIRGPPTALARLDSPSHPWGPRLLGFPGSPAGLCHPGRQAGSSGRKKASLPHHV